MSEAWQSHLQSIGAQFDQGRVVTFGDTKSENQALVESAAILCDLSHLGLIRVTGENAADFLQAQFCNDILALNDHAAQWNGWCSPKGRLLATFLVWKTPQEYFLQLPRVLQATIQKHLQMFVLRSKVKLEDVSSDWVRIGLAGPSVKTVLQNMTRNIPPCPMQAVSFNSGWLIRISAQRFEMVTTTEQALTCWSALATSARAVGANGWDWHAIQEGVITILPEIHDAFVPQMVNLDLIGGLSFKKGCYPGQEIVARTQYRGTLKRRMVSVHIDVDRAPQPGEKVFSARFGDQAAGEIANVAKTPSGGFDALVVAQIESIKMDDLKYGAMDGPVLTLLPQPYTIPFPVQPVSRQ